MKKNLLLLASLFFSISISIQAQTQTVNFDGLSAPGGFFSQTATADSYSDGCVTFLNNFEVLDCVLGGFSITGFSTPNALKWNNFGTSTGSSEVITFCQAVMNPSLKLFLGSGSGNFIVEGFNSANTSLGVQNITATSSGTTVTVTSNDVSRIEITVPNNTFGAIDDISYTLTPVVATAPIPTMSQWGLLIFGLLIMNLSVFYVQRRELI